MDDRAYWIAQGSRAAESVCTWSAFVAATEFLWQDADLIKDSDAWQALWFELEIVNALALAEWDEQGRPGDWSVRWCEGYQQDAAELARQLLALLACD
nr:hypothetical protein [uncultured Pseudomonas sp.]